MKIYKQPGLVILLLCCTLVIGNQFAYGKSSTFASTGSFVKNFPGYCSDSDAIKKIIADAIELGAPIYNAGLHTGCYRIYEWAAYKILYIYGSNCKEVEKIVKKAIDKSHGDYSDTEKAWLMRAAFDMILGEPTRTGTPQKDGGEKNSSIKG